MTNEIETTEETEDLKYQELKAALKIALNNFNYKEVITITQKITTLPNYSITAGHALKCIIAFKKTNTYLEYIPKLEAIIASKRPDSNFKVFMGMLYHNHRLYTEAKKILLEAISDPKSAHDPLAYSYLGKTCLELGLYDDAKTYLLKSLELNPNSKYRPLINKLLKCCENKAQKSSNRFALKDFLSSKRTLAPGYIVYLRPDSNIKSNVPYLIYHVTPNIIYAFALTPYKTLETYHLSPETNKDNLEFYLSGRIAKFYPTDIENIRTHINIDFLPDIMKNLALYYTELNPLIDPKKIEFLSFIKKDIKLHSIIVLKNTSYQEEYYFIVGIKEDGYEAVKLDFASGLYIPTDINVIIDKHIFIPSVINLNSRQINNILNLLKKEPLTLKLKK